MDRHATIDRLILLSSPSVPPARGGDGYRGCGGSCALPKLPPGTLSPSEKLTLKMAADIARERGDENLKASLLSMMNR